MKREGRQHGMVRSYPILEPPFNHRPESRYVNGFDSPPTAGIFTKVSSKPTNHSKPTGKCGLPKCFGCHTHPVCKSKPKAKGTQKLQSCDVVSNHRLVSWRVVDSKSGLKFSGFSASGVLDYLDSDYSDVDDEDCVDEVHEESCELPHPDSVELETASGAVDIKDHGENKDDDDDEIVDMSFYHVETVWAVEEEDEEWCLVSDH